MPMPALQRQFERSGQVPVELRLTDIYWVYIAIRQVGIDGNQWSMQRASERLGVSRYRLSRWLQRGIGNAGFGEVMKLSELSGISAESFRNCWERRPSKKGTTRGRARLRLARGNHRPGG